jgi:hypothetical protein
VAADHNYKVLRLGTVVVALIGVGIALLSGLVSLVTFVLSGESAALAIFLPGAVAIVGVALLAGIAGGRWTWVGAVLIGLASTTVAVFAASSLLNPVGDAWSRAWPMLLSAACAVFCFAVAYSRWRARPTDVAH